MYITSLVSLGFIKINTYIYRLTKRQCIECVIYASAMRLNINICSLNACLLSSYLIYQRESHISTGDLVTDGFPLAMGTRGTDSVSPSLEETWDSEGRGGLGGRRAWYSVLLPCSAQALHSIFSVHTDVHKPSFFLLSQTQWPLLVSHALGREIFIFSCRPRLQVAILIGQPALSSSTPNLCITLTSSPEDEDMS